MAKKNTDLTFTKAFGHVRNKVWSKEFLIFLKKNEAFSIILNKSKLIPTEKHQEIYWKYFSNGKNNAYNLAY